MAAQLIDVIGSGIQLSKPQWDKLIKKLATDLNAPNAYGQTALCVAITTENQENAVQALVDAGADPKLMGVGATRVVHQMKSYSPLYHALARQFSLDSAHGEAFGLCSVLLKAGADPTTMEAVEPGVKLKLLETVQTLLAALICIRFPGLLSLCSKSHHLITFRRLVA